MRSTREIIAEISSQPQRPPCHLDCSEYEDATCPLDGQPCDHKTMPQDNEPTSHLPMRKIAV
jgi:hypothetical protein